MKKCCECKEVKLKSEFSKDNTRKDGLQTRCIVCQKIYAANHYKGNKEKYNISRDKCRNSNPTRSWARNSLGHHKQNKFILNITIDDLEYLAIKTTHCKYCGCELYYTVKERGKVMSCSPSLDRTENEKELHLNNIQIICHLCNSTKRNRTHREFIEYCKLISSKF